MALRTRTKKNVDNLQVNVREAQTEEEMRAACTLRAQSFYAYPPGREFAGKLHQMMVAEEELAAMKSLKLKERDGDGRERYACLVALAPTDTLLVACPEELLAGSCTAVVGTLDLMAVRAVPGEVLIGKCRNAAYLANVCVADVARERRVGTALLRMARSLCRDWGVDGLYVHIMAVNEVGLEFYKRNGFEVEKEETVNEATERGHCLDGIEGRGRTLLLRDTSIS
eukprot:jgi/Botrbrau1/17679/Bobra.0166s0103.2